MKLSSLPGHRGLWSLLLLLLLPAVVAAAQAAEAVAAVPPPVRFITHHQVMINGAKVAFTATAGETYLYDDNGAPTASIFTYAYLRDVAAGTRRPVLFITGGGPGGASYMANIGLFGPWYIRPGRLALDAAHPPSPVPPWDVVENPDSLLDVADLVFIDPVGTGYSRAIGAARNQDFWGLDEDLESLAQFIQLWLTQNGRWDSPKFFMGESYGGTRAALLPNILMGGPTYPGNLRAITLNGTIILVNGLGMGLGADGLSPAWNAATAFPNQALAAWYHQSIDRKGRTLEQFYDEATRFALGDYVAALRKEADKSLPADERTAIVARIGEYTGLPAAALEKSLSLDEWTFSKVALASRGLTVGVYDSRFTFTQAGGGGDPVADDPALGRFFPVLTGAFLDNEHAKLGVRMDRPFFAIHWRDLLTHWNYQHRGNWLGTGGTDADYRPKKYATNAEELAAAMNRNDHLYALVATGYYDMLMSPAQARYTTEQAGIPKDRLVLVNYEAGHEPYVDPAAGVKVANAIRELIRKASR
ncbi:MAG: hypothetical protein U1F30_16395 [Steroidobacteraceae bacterium]